MAADWRILFAISTCPISYHFVMHSAPTLRENGLQGPVHFVWECLTIFNGKARLFQDSETHKYPKV